MEEDVEEQEFEEAAEDDGEAEEDAEVDGDLDLGAEEALEEAPPAAKRRKATDASQVLETAKEPDSLEGWKAAQDRLFGHMRPLRKGWIRIRSKSKGLLYYYNVVSGESTEIEPLR